MLCKSCPNMSDTSIGTCSSCQRPTISSSHDLCGSCSQKQNRCAKRGCRNQIRPQTAPGSGNMPKLGIIGDPTANTVRCAEHTDVRGLGGCTRKRCEECRRGVDLKVRICGNCATKDNPHRCQVCCTPISDDKPPGGS